METTLPTRRTKTLRPEAPGPHLYRKAWELYEYLKPLVEREIILGVPFPPNSRKGRILAKHFPTAASKIAFFKTHLLKSWQNHLSNVPAPTGKCPKGEDPEIWDIRCRLRRYLREQRLGYYQTTCRGRFARKLHRAFHGRRRT